MKAPIIFALLALSSPLVFADSLTSQVKACSAIQSKESRLLCYDQAASSLEQLAVEGFGQEQKRIAQEAPEHIEARIVTIQTGAHDKQFISLDNGQLWKQNDSSRIHWKAGDLVVVERALFGSFFMKPLEGGKKLRVKRVK
ncbi:hypothetical protein MO867_07020 [Microbulbifer sp. OS29]|uniref:Lipoprotein n=1 Tax=Microbulbifer okhotskensis TaxID=2926617 RepID=A0A9X2J423_9GAMM|nr:hypothetical protein [Microbulbifer okhotskensis]MCO1334092.1 hypothetical protein [Microbulbifer okhotskensis]